MFQLQDGDAHQTEHGPRHNHDESVAYDYGNSLVENEIALLRQLACSLMHQLHSKWDVQL